MPEYHYPKGEVLLSLEDVTLRKAMLERATTLGNAYHSKVKIDFETTNGIKEVETTIWATTEKYVLLKGGIAIPIHCILDVRM
ncbi:MAG: hypothetical protein JKY33_03395 [Bacteroidia bacterium]|nr:hypothetical protein [Bacteroidia bacterium]